MYFEMMWLDIFYGLEPISLWLGAGRTAQAGQLDGSGWPAAAVRQAGGRTDSPAAGLPRVVVLVVVGGGGIDFPHE